MLNILSRLNILLFYLALDLAGVFIAVILAYATYRQLGLGHGVIYDFSYLLRFALLIGGVVLMLFFYFGAYSRESGILNVKEIRNVIVSLLCSLLLVNTLFFALRLMPSRYFVFLCFGYLLLILPLLRSVVYNHLTNAETPRVMRNVLIFGAGELGQRLFREITNSPRLHIRVVGFVDDDPAKQNSCIWPTGFNTNKQCEVLGTFHELTELINCHQVDEVYLAISRVGSDHFKRILEVCSNLSVPIAFVPFLHEIYAHRVYLEHLGHIPLIRENHGQRMPYFDQIKRVMDLSLSILLGMVLMPMMFFIALLIRYDSRGPILFKQHRVGKDGKVFLMYKFRSMVHDAPQYAMAPVNPNDPRITKLGRFLRKTSMDELPQIINIFKGEMSFVGPRPEMPFVVEQYNEIHRERLKVIPGITGLWQLSGDRKKAIHENMDYDLYYVYNRSFFLDLTILLQTLIFAFKGV